MAINFFSETSPRISFSNDLCQADVAPIVIDPCKSRNSQLSILENPDFVFCVSRSFEHESSSADELFSNGVIKIQERPVAPRSVAPPIIPSPSATTTNEGLKKESSKGIPESSCGFQEKLQAASKSLWPFKRSTSLNCDHIHRRTLMCSLPLLSRSNSTGSVPNSKSSSKQNSQKQASMAKSTSSNTYPVSQKRPLKKHFGGSYGNGVWISPVINVPPAYISKGTANFFGLGSLFRNGKDKKSKK